MHKEGYYSSGEFAKKANVTVTSYRGRSKVLYGFRFYEAAADTVV